MSSWVIGMRPDQTIESHSAAQPESGICEPNFYLVPFAPQMIVWAVRRRLHALHHAEKASDNVVQVFHLAAWGELYAPLLDVTQILVRCAQSMPLRLHSVTCPHLERYEVYLLNALAHLQRGQREDAVLCVCEVMTPRGARLALPHLESIAKQLLSQNLNCPFISAVDGSSGHSQHEERKLRRKSNVH